MKAARLVGVYRLGVDNVRVYAGEAEGGVAASFEHGPADGGTPKIVIGCKGRQWLDVVASVLHESMESMMHRKGAGRVPTHVLRVCPDEYSFVLDHTAFSQCCDVVGAFMSDCLPDLSAVWRNLNPKR